MEDIDCVARDSKLSFNCPECKKFWRGQLEHWKDLGIHIKGMHLHCPKCSPVKIERPW